MLIAAMRVKNEAWIIKYTLSALSEFVDKIVIIDDGSTDDTVSICSSYPKVVEIFLNNHKSENSINEAKDWNYLTKLARKHGASWILYTDADEMLEPKIKDFSKTLPQLKGFNMIRFRKVSPWKGLSHYRVDANRFDSAAARNLNPVLVNASCQIRWDDGRGSFFIRLAKVIFRKERMMPSLGRGFPKGVGSSILNNDQIVAVHFNHISYERLIRKQIFYALVEKHNRPLRTRSAIVEWVIKGCSERGIVLKEMNSNWIWQDYRSLINMGD